MALQVTCQRFSPHHRILHTAPTGGAHGAAGHLSGTPGRPHSTCRKVEAPEALLVWKGREGREGRLGEFLRGAASDLDSLLVVPAQRIAATLHALRPPPTARSPPPSAQSGHPTFPCPRPGMREGLSSVLTGQSHAAVTRQCVWAPVSGRVTVSG